MNAGFDAAAGRYDDVFTNSVIGRSQRRQVYRHLSDVLADRPVSTVLEINCGTGEDAIWLANQGIAVTATDISERMIETAKAKPDAEKVIFSTADINRIQDHVNGQTFDMVLSNFGGLNCLDPGQMERFFANISRILRPNGRLVVVVMPKNTLWECFYFLSKGTFTKMFRRQKKAVVPV